MTVLQTERVEISETILRGFDDFEVRVGDLMRGERATLGKSLLDAQRDLKIPGGYLAAIEDADLSVFRHHGIVAGYVRSYARYLGMDPEWVLAQFCIESGLSISGPTSLSGKSAQSSVRQISAAPGDPSGAGPVTFQARTAVARPMMDPGAVGSLAVLVALIAGLGYGAWSVFREVQRVQLGPIENAPALVTEIDPLANLSKPTTAILQTVDPVTAGLNAPALPELPVLVRRDTPIATINPYETRENVVPVAEAAIATALGAKDRLVRAAVQEIYILAVRPAWVRVEAADGTVLLERILNAGERYAVPMQDPAPTLRSGNSGSIYFEIDGQAYGPAGTGDSVVKHLTLSATRLIETIAAADLAQDTDLARFAAAN